MSQINGRLNAQGNITGSLNGAGGGGGATALTQLTDVNISNPSNNQALVYNFESSKWVNSSLPAGADELSDLNDVDTEGALVGDVLMLMNAGGGGGGTKWVAYPSLFISEKFFSDYELDVLWVLGTGRASMEFNNDISNKVIDLHFSSPNVCPSAITVSYNQQTEKWKIQITIPSEYEEANLKCLLTLRDKKGS